ncbi:formate dehydrogenase subunit delta [Streptomyces sp. NPDC001292]|uniref:formate dehydrogenase subunit delta n=1 Tax=Streptomyces sp. NPDC001292 TaxID=3364558 RepID=UPI00367B6378
MGQDTPLRLAYDIAAQFAHYPFHDATAAIADHIVKFWDPRMRAQLIEQVERAGERCDARVLGAALLVRDRAG